MIVMQTANNNTAQKEAAANTVEAAKSTAANLFRKLRTVLRGLSFWTMALLCLGLRCFVKYPLGPLLALVVGTVWCVENMESVRRFFRVVQGKVTGHAKGCESSSLWYEHGGREQIGELIAALSAKGKCFCNLAEEIKMPPQSHWFAIGKALGEQGVKTQISGDAFFIAWENKQEKPHD